MKLYILIPLQHALGDPKEELTKWFQWSPARERSNQMLVRMLSQRPAACSSAKSWHALGAGEAPAGFGRLWYDKWKSPSRTTVAKDTVLLKIRKPGYAMNLKVSNHVLGVSANELLFTYQSATILQVSEKNAATFAPAPAAWTDLIFDLICGLRPWALCLVFVNDAHNAQHFVSRGRRCFGELCSR